MARWTIENQAAFLAGVTGALTELQFGEGAVALGEWGALFAETARELAPTLKRPDPERTAGELKAAIGARPGVAAGGPYVDVGVLRELPDDYPFFVEFGTAFARAQPFMRPALARLRSALGTGGGAAILIRTPTTRGILKRAGKRAIIRSYARRGAITSAEARGASRQVSSRFRTRYPRRRR